LGTFVAIGVELCLFGDCTCSAQTTSPTIVAIFPAGGCQGTTVEATVIGEGIAGTSGIYISDAGVTAEIVGEETTEARKGNTEKPKPWNNAQVATNLVHLSLKIAPDAALGARDLRLVTPGGLTQRWRFFVDELPELVVTQPNDSPDTAVPLPSMPVVANGQIYSGWVGTIASEGKPDRAFFRFDAKAGQTLVCQVQARELIPHIDQAVPGFFDACVMLRDATGRRVQYVDDFLFKPDPVLLHKVEEDAKYSLEVRDVIYRSSHDFIYRMRLGTLPYITRVFPLGGRRNTEVELELYGVNLPGDHLSLKIPADSPATRRITVDADGLTSNSVPLAVDDLPEVMEADANGETADPQPVTAPVVINGRIETPGNTDAFTFHAEAGDELSLEVLARRLGSPLDSILTLYDSAGEQLDQFDDPAPQAVPNSLGTGVENDMGVSVHPRDALLLHRADARIVHTFESAGEYVVRIADVAEKGGPEYAYRLRIAPAKKDFTLRITTDAASVGQDDTALVAVNALRTDGFDGPIRVEMQDLPPGCVTDGTIIPAGQTDAHLTISVAADAALGLHFPRFVGSAEIDQQTQQREGIPVQTVGQAFYIKHMVPTQGFLLHIGERTFYTLSTDVPPRKELEIPKGGELKLVVKASRLETGKGPISIEAVSLPAGVSVKVKNVQIGAGQDAVELTLTASSNATPDTVGSLIFSGTLNVDKQSVVRVTPAIPLKIIAAE